MNTNQSKSDQFKHGRLVLSSSFPLQPIDSGAKLIQCQCKHLGLDGVFFHFFFFIQEPTNMSACMDYKGLQKWHSERSSIIYVCLWPRPVRTRRLPRTQFHCVPCPYLPWRWPFNRTSYSHVTVPCVFLSSFLPLLSTIQKRLVWKTCSRLRTLI